MGEWLEDVLVRSATTPSFVWYPLTPHQEEWGAQAYIAQVG